MTELSREASLCWEGGHLVRGALEIPGMYVGGGPGQAAMMVQRAPGREVLGGWVVIGGCCPGMGEGAGVVPPGTSGRGRGCDKDQVPLLYPPLGSGPVTVPGTAPKGGSREGRS